MAAPNTAQLREASIFFITRRSPAVHCCCKHGWCRWGRNCVEWARTRKRDAYWRVDVGDEAEWKRAGE
eukprot:9187352-Prorocentrum_lima.AAC.1